MDAKRAYYKKGGASSERVCYSYPTEAQTWQPMMEPVQLAMKGTDRGGLEYIRPLNFDYL